MSTTHTLHPPGSVRPRRARITAVTSGKGGVGKTVCSANLAAAMAAQGRRVLVMDADLGLANLDVLLHLASPRNLSDVINGHCSVQQALVPAPGGFDAVLAGSGVVEHSRMTEAVRHQLYAALDELVQQYDEVLLDTGAGISDVVLFTVSMADEVLLITTPEPTAMTDAYATAKVLATFQGRRELLLLVNQVREPGEGRLVARQLQSVTDRFLNRTLDSALHLQFVAEVPNDMAVRDAVQRRSLMLQAQPGAPASRALVHAATQLLRRPFSRADG